ncbi:hypothetical protein [Streptomyces sp. LARHCF252]
MSTEQELTRQYIRLQEKVGEHRAEALKHSPGDDRFAVEYARLVNAVGSRPES